MQIFGWFYVAARGDFSQLGAEFSVLMAEAHRGVVQCLFSQSRLSTVIDFYCLNIVTDGVL